MGAVQLEILQELMETRFHRKIRFGTAGLPTGNHRGHCDRLRPF